MRHAAPASKRASSELGRLRRQFRAACGRGAQRLILADGRPAIRRRRHIPARRQGVRPPCSVRPPPCRRRSCRHCRGRRPAFVAPHGGNRPVIGTNPLALAMGQGADRVVIDLASSRRRWPTVRPPGPRARLARRDRGRCQRANRRASRPMSQRFCRAAARSARLLGLMVELLAGVAGGGRGDPKGRGVFMIAFDPARRAKPSTGTTKLAGLKADWTQAAATGPAAAAWTPGRKLDAIFAVAARRPSCPACPGGEGSIPS
jgi:hypothetical protein